jgi:hypothetical protein
MTKFLFAAAFVAASIGVAACVPDAPSKPPMAAEEVAAQKQETAEYERCWRDRQYREAVRSGKWGMDALNSVDMGPIYRDCLILAKSKQVPASPVKPSAAMQEWGQCVGDAIRQHRDPAVCR